MSDDYTYRDGQVDTLTQGEPGPPPRVWFIWIAIFLGIVLLMFFRDRMNTNAESITQHRFEELVDANQIVHAAVIYDAQNPELNEIVGQYYKVDQGARLKVPFRVTVRLTRRLEEKLLSLSQFEPRQANHTLMNVVFSVLPFVVIALFIWFFFIRRIKRVARASVNSPDLQARTAEQQDRFDRILDKWEAQAKRMDAVLDKMEREK